MAPPEALGGCKILHPIGAGAASVIYRARDLSTGQIVAVKYLAVEEKPDRKYLRHARNEYKVLQALQNAHGGEPPEGIVKVFRLIRRGRLKQRKEHILVMEYVDGLDLRRESRYPMGQVVDLLCQVSNALSRLHAEGYIHGDLKPENVVVDHSGTAKLVDFGFACRSGTQAQSVRGTRDYMAPEQLNKGYLTEKTDLYNFGATMYFLLTGRNVPAMIPAQNDPAHFIAGDTAAAPPRELKPEVPVALDAVTMRCLEKEPIARPACVEEVRDVLEEVRARFVQ